MIHISLVERPKSKKLVCIVVSDINRVMAFEALVEHLSQDRFMLDFLLLNPGPSALEGYLIKKGISMKRVLLRGRRDYPLAFVRVFLHFLRKRPDVVNTHLIDASILALPAAWMLKVPHRILTRHHSTFHHEFARHFVIVDRILSALATRIVAVSPLVARILIRKELVPAAKIATVEHGFDLEAFSHTPENRVAALRKKYGLEQRGPVIGVISRYIKWKGVQYVLPAFRKLLETHPQAVLCLANAVGPDTEWLRAQMKGIPRENLLEIEFESDPHALFRCFDLFVHVPVNEHCEAFGQVYVESLAAGLPCIFTQSGIAADLARDHRNCLVVPFADSEAIHRALLEILEGRVPLAPLRDAARESVKQFGIREMIGKLEAIYNELP